MIVADTNLVGYLLIDGPLMDLVRAVWFRDSDWRLPALWRSEFLNLLAKSTRGGMITNEVAHSLWRRSHSLFSNNEVVIDGDDVLDLAASRGISAYDAHFVAAAIKLDVPLVTADKPLLAACSDLTLSPEAFLQL